MVVAALITTHIIDLNNGFSFKNTKVPMSIQEG